MHTFVVIVRGILLLVAAGAAVLHLISGLRAVNSFADSGELSGRLIATFLPLSSRETDYVGRGWYYRRVQLVCAVVFVSSLIIWGFLGSLGA